MRIRSATPADAEALLALYAPYITDTAITFEYEVPTVNDFRGRIEHTVEEYPYLVAVESAESHVSSAGSEEHGSSVGSEEHGSSAGRSETVLGYAYASAFKERAAYDWATETSIYVAQDARGKGVGGALHAALKDALVDKGIQNMCACITVVPEGLERDPYITNNSMKFHEHLGYQLVGRFHKVGYKFGRWYDMVWMELMIGSHPMPAPRLG